MAVIDLAQHERSLHCGQLNTTTINDTREDNTLENILYQSGRDQPLFSLSWRQGVHNHL